MLPPGWDRAGSRDVQREEEDDDGLAVDESKRWCAARSGEGAGQNDVVGEAWSLPGSGGQAGEVPGSTCHQKRNLPGLQVPLSQHVWALPVWWVDWLF